MKVFKLKLVLTLFVGLLITSCTQDNLNESEENQILDFTELEFDFLNEEFTFEGTKKEVTNQLLNKLDAYMFSKDLFAKPNEVGNVKWLISYTDNKLVVKQSVHTPPEDLSKSRSCPEGLTEYASCSGVFTKSCTKKRAAELANEIKPGETFSVTRTGPMSTLICGTPSLVDRVR
ncbi:hypothetical protein SAMN05444278_10242 [Psychroflexus salarius]|uniref:Lipoprotein n=1 Tax=Psychroflexus salarius TaxID=1155689 RepID=A0A1M4TVF3_9FLAO|nr:hypothetical protein [Psychroflexus salarius]SHE48384.1 hypothetical protein SAMN05444278_10242 [Psychroflexus salarius]